MDQDASAGWKPQVERGRKPLYQAIADAIADDVRNGRLAVGARLPPQRDLAAFLGVDLTTVTRGYNEARRRGLLKARVGQGSFVAAPAAGQAYGAPTGAPVDLTMNMPPIFDDGALTRRMWRGLSDLETRGGMPLLLRYQEPGGTRDDRATGALWLQGGIPGVGADRTLVAPGAQTALVAVLASLVNPGDVIFTEEIAYPGVRAAAAYLDVTLAGLEMDAEGIVPASFARVCRDLGPKALCCTPTLQNPTTATMTTVRRQEIVAIARRYHVAIVEDDAYGRLPEHPEPPLAALAPEITWHIAGLAKLVGPALRIAYVVPPDTRAVAQVAGKLRAAAGMASPLTAALATRWIRTGVADDVLRAIRAESRARREIAAQVLGAAFAEPAEAFHLWLPLPAPWTRAAFQSALRSHEVSVVPSDAFVVSGDPPEAVRIGLGAPATRDELAHGLRAVAQVLDGRPAWEAYV